MTYSFSTNSTPATGSVAMFTFKELLKTAGWTVKSSSDGTTFNSTGDQISSGASGAGGMANNSAWFRIQAPSTDGVTREYTVQRGTANTVWRVKYSQSAGFTGGTPGATQTPSATDENTLLGGGTDASPTFTALFGTDGTYRYNAIAGGSSEKYTFYSFGFPSGGGTPTHIMFFERMAAGSFPASNVEPYVMWFANNSPSVANLTSTSNVKGWLAKGLAGQGFVVVPAMNHTDNTSRAEGALGANSYTGIDDLLPILWARRSALGAPAGYMGIGDVIRFIGTTRTTGDTYTINTTNDRIVVGDITVPWDGSTPTI